MIGAKDGIKSSVEQEYQDFYARTLASYAINIEQELARKLLTENDKLTYYFKFNFNSLLRASANERADYYNKGIRGGWLSRNEARMFEDANGFDGGDEYLIESNLMPSSKINEYMDAKIAQLMKQEKRTFTGTVIARADGENMPKEIGGIAAVINSVTDLGYFEEVINAGAFDYALSKEYDIRCLFNHEAELILGRTKADTCKVFVNADGNLEYTWVPDYENPTHMSVVRSIMRGDITQSSFAFTIKEQSWTTSEKYGNMGKRVITVIEDLYDVSPVTYPAYADTEADARSIAAMRDEEQEIEAAKRSQASADVLRLALLRYENL
jgi:HK97 family phage prohead protease